MVALDTKIISIWLKPVQAKGFNCSLIQVVTRNFLIFLYVHANLVGYGDLFNSIVTC